MACCIEDFISQGSIKPLVITIFPRVSWIDTDRFNANTLQPTSVEATKDKIVQLLTVKFQDFVDLQKHKDEEAMHRMDKKRQALVLVQRKERSQLKQKHQKRWDAKAKARSVIFPKGFKAIWLFVTGKYQEIKRQNEVETLTCKL